MASPHKPLDTVTLRRRAEEKVGLETASFRNSMSTDTVLRLPHELRVQQIQLELQNEELLRVQAELDAARARYFDLYDLAPVGYVTLGGKGVILEANLTAASLLGVDRSALTQQPLVRFILAADQEAYFQYRQQLLGTSLPQVCELRMVRAKAAPFWARLEATMAAGEDGASICRVVLSDITAQKQVEQTLQESEARFRNLLQGVESVAVQGYATDGTTQYWNQASEQLYGYSAQEAIGRNLLDLVVPPEMRDDVRQAMRQMAETGKPIPAAELELMRKDGSRVAVFSSHTIVQVHGRAQELFCIDIDLTERKQAGEDLARERQLLRTLVDNLPDAVYTKDAEGRKTLANRVDVSNLGAASEADVLGKTDADLLAPEVAERLLADDLTVIRTGAPLLNVEELLVDAHGTRRWLLTSKIPLKDAGGKVVSLVGIGHDITDLKRAEAEREKLEEQLRQAQKLEAVGRLAGGVAHDFNNMLQTILGTTELLLTDAEPEDPRTADLHEIMAAARRSADLTRQLLAFARKQTIVPRVLNLNDMVANMSKMLARLIGEDVRLVWRPGAGLGPVKVDPSQLDQILANLAVNARDAIGGVGTLTIETANAELDATYCQAHPDVVPGAYVMLLVADTGCGMSQETLAHMFEPFFTTKQQGKGTGLGLATVYGIVRQNNGVIDLVSEPGKGTTFRIYLPRHAATARETAEALNLTADPTGSETVLVVEDEVSLLRLARRLLESLGYTVLVADSPGQAIRVATEYAGNIDLLLTDVVMPESSGRDLRERLGPTRPEMKCLFMSGYTADAIAHRGVLDEGLHFIQKPFAKAALAVKVRDVLDGRAKG